MELSITYRIPRPTVPGLLWGPDDRELIRPEIEGVAAMYWPINQVENAVRVALAESGWRTGAWAYVGEDSRGLWQINIEYWKQFAQYNLFDPLVNGYFAHQIWATEGWKPWSSAERLGLL